MNTPATRRFLVEHQSSFHYAEPAHGSMVLLRLQPQENPDQRLLKYSLSIEPDAATNVFEDAFGNTCHLFNIHRKHARMTVHSRSLVEISAKPPPEKHTDADNWNTLAETVDRVRYWEYLNPSRFVYKSPSLQAFMDEKDIRPGASALSALLKTASTLHAAFRYMPGSTKVDSPIEHILETGEGVCQDYTHVLLAIARSWGIPSRYVSGYLHMLGTTGDQAPAGVSHSWGEFWLPDSGWVGIDPTNNSLANDRHVRVAVGRDYADAAPTRGTYFSGGNSTLEVTVTVAESDETVPRATSQAERTNFLNISPVARTLQTRPDQ